MINNVRTYHKDDCITFKSTKGTFGGLSNMASGFPIKIGDIYIRNSEVLYQSLRFSDYPEIQKVLYSINSPITAKQFSRKCSDKTRADWYDHRFKIMRLCIELKLTHNWLKFSDILLETGNLSIVEYSTEDKIWGACKQGNYYEGVNALGRLLMELREKVKNNIFVLTIPDIKNLKILDFDLKGGVIEPYLKQNF